jgi:hypothetical protein
MCSVYTGFAVYSKRALTLDPVYTGFVAYSKNTTTLDPVSQKAIVGEHQILVILGTTTWSNVGVALEYIAKYVWQVMGQM